ncbi:hypothetical protein EVAR_25993_1 [Eumeta japonica]|uniref:Uncharacterized protein n=1 Tax=Eumeta variegata TaxID=151549 RepID=A0A4C1V2Z8_EUMVA|nr:hypothetical protein EVAR_25993_1 [Eumeta japonica]
MTDIKTTTIASVKLALSGLDVFAYGPLLQLKKGHRHHSFVRDQSKSSSASREGADGWSIPYKTLLELLDLTEVHAGPVRVGAPYDRRHRRGDTRLRAYTQCLIEPLPSSTSEMSLKLVMYTRDGRRAVSRGDTARFHYPTNLFSYKDLRG